MIRLRLYLHLSAALLTSCVAVVPALADTATAESQAKTSESPLTFEHVARTVEIGYYPREFFVDFLFSVHGEGAVSIRNFSSTCPCTTVASDKTVYYPGQKGLVAAVFSYRGDPSPDVQVVRVQTDRSPRTQLLQVVPRRTDAGLWVERHELRWTGAPSRLAQKVDVEVSPELKERTPVVELNVTGWQASLEAMEPAGRFRLTVQPTIENPPAAQVRLKLSPARNETEARARSAPEATIALFPGLSSSPP